MHLRGSPRERIYNENNLIKSVFTDDYCDTSSMCRIIWIVSSTLSKALYGICLHEVMCLDFGRCGAFQTQQAK